MDSNSFMANSAISVTMLVNIFMDQYIEAQTLWYYADNQIIFEVYVYFGLLVAISVNCYHTG